MKKNKLVRLFILFVTVVVLSTSFTFAQEATTKKNCETSKKSCCSTSSAKTAKHVCTDECKTLGCDVVKAKEVKAIINKHKCTDECKVLGCDVVKAKEAKATINKHKCTDECKNGCTAKS